MAYLVLARKYRPQIFEDVVKQDHVTQTLMHAISSDRIAHAILFSGPRGTGKTTIARILAKAMNCQDGPAPVPCNKCRSCKEITSGNAPDVFEIDGASNNGVEQVRELRSNIKYMPAYGRYKIYIIDEVHMLSKPAFNALLKTLEEPPSHVLFFFATTEPHKIPITILSRCQQHDLRRIDLDAISQHMKSICAKEKIKMSDESLDLIGREAGGCMRDALSLLDQVISCTEGEITHKSILDILGLIDRKIIFDISQSLLENNITSFLNIVDDIYNKGHDIKKLYSELIEHFRNLLVVKMGKMVSTLVDVPSHEIELMKAQTDNMSETYLNQIWTILFSEETVIKFSANPRLAFEMIFIRMFQVKPALPVDTLIKKIDTLRKELSEKQPKSCTGDTRQAAFQNKNQLPEQAVKETAEAFRDTPSQDPPRQDVAQKTYTADKNPLPEDKDNAWGNIIEIIAKEHPSLSALLVDSTILNLTDTSLQIQVSNNEFNINMLKRNKNMNLLKKVCDEFFKKEMNLDIQAKIISNHNAHNGNNSRLKQEAINHPLVADAVEVFDGKVVDVKIL